MKGDAAVVIACYNLGRTVLAAIDSARHQTRPPAEIVVVDDGSTDVFTCQTLGRIHCPTVRVIRTSNNGPAAARNTGIGLTTSPYVTLLDADDMLEPTYLEKTAAVLDADDQIAFVTCALRDAADEESVWTPPVCRLVDLLVRGGAPVTSLFRREVWTAVRGFDERLAAWEDIDFWASAVAHGFRGAVLPEALVTCRYRRGSRSDLALRTETHATTMATLLAKQRPALSETWKELLLAKDEFIFVQRDHQKHLVARSAGLERKHIGARREIRGLTDDLREHGILPFDIADVRGVKPLSDVWGLDRGKPVDRYYIEHFLARFQADIRGAVAEIKDSGYSAWFGGDAVTRHEVIDIDTTNTQATKIADLSDPGAFNANEYDCFVCTQTLMCVYDVRGALQSAYKMLRPGGVMLCTVSALNRVSHEDTGPDGDYWRFTEASMRRLLAEVFPVEQFEVFSFGNVRACSMFLYGVSVEELSSEDLDAVDPDFPLVVAVRAVKPHASEAEARRTATLIRVKPTHASAVLMYHRIADENPDGDLLAMVVSRRRFLEHLDALASECDIVPLEQLAGAGEPPADRPAVALTFDDGTRDHADLARLLAGRRLPATFFVTTGDLDRPHEHYWDILEWIFGSEHALPERLSVAAGATDTPLPTRTPAERRAAMLVVADRLAPMRFDERDRVMRRLANWAAVSPTVRESHRALTSDEVLMISKQPEQSVGSHSVHHLVLPAQPLEIQVREILTARLSLEQLIGRPVRAFCYPYGVWDASTAEVVRAAGHDIGVTADERVITPGERPLTLPRLEVGNESALDLLSRLGL